MPDCFLTILNVQRYISFSFRACCSMRRNQRLIAPVWQSHHHLHFKKPFLEPRSKRSGRDDCITSPAKGENGKRKNKRVRNCAVVCIRKEEPEIGLFCVRSPSLFLSPGLGHSLCEAGEAFDKGGLINARRSMSLSRPNGESPAAQRTKIEQVGLRFWTVCQGGRK